MLECSDYARTLNMPDHLTCSIEFWNACSCLRFWMCQSSEYGTVVYARVTQGSEYVWIWLNMTQCLNMPQYVLMPLNMPEHGWIVLNVPEYAWKWLNKLFWQCASICLTILDIWQGFEYVSGIKYTTVLMITSLL